MKTGATLNSSLLTTLSPCPKVIYALHHHHHQQQQPINCSSSSRISSFSFPFHIRQRYVSYPERITQRACQKRLQPMFAVLQGEKEGDVLTSEFEEFSISTTGANENGEIKVSVEVYGPKTQAIFDRVFGKMVEAAQPIPGFRREKGGKTPNIPKDILLEILGHSKVYKQVIKTVINFTVAVYIQETGLKVSKNLKVEQSFEDLEASFEPGETFSFDAILQRLG